MLQVRSQVLGCNKVERWSDDGRWRITSVALVALRPREPSNSVGVATASVKHLENRL